MACRVVPGLRCAAQLTTSSRSAEISSSSSLKRSVNQASSFLQCRSSSGRGEHPTEDDARKVNGQMHSLCLGHLLGKDPEDEVGLFAWFEGGGHDEILPWGQVKTCADLTQVYKGLGASARRVRQEEVLLQVDVLAALEL